MVLQDEKRRNFERLAVKRTDDILKKLKLLGNLSNKNNYSYSEEHVRQIFSAIERELKATQGRFTAHAGKAEPAFRFNKIDR